MLLRRDPKHVVDSANSLGIPGVVTTVLKESEGACGRPAPESRSQKIYPAVGTEAVGLQIPEGEGNGFPARPAAES